ncbi:MAG: ribonuclease III [Pseudomonadota bacterium]
MSDGDCGSHHGDLTAALKYQFRDPGLLAEALLHPSVNPQDRGGALHGYQRLEFLGDRVIGLLAAQWLLEKHPKESEGAIARRHAHLVRGRMLAIIAEDLDLGRFVALSPSEEAAGGRHNPAILADIMEALAGAVFLDGGIEPARSLLFPLFDKHIDHAEGPPRDPKTGLQEWAQARGLDLPTYRVIGRDGPAHKPEFHVEASIAGWPPMSAKGDTKRQAEKRAAAALLTAVDRHD